MTASVLYPSTTIRLQSAPENFQDFLHSFVVTLTQYFPHNITPTKVWTDIWARNWKLIFQKMVLQRHTDFGIDYGIDFGTDFGIECGTDVGTDCVIWGLRIVVLILVLILPDM